MKTSIFEITLVLPTMIHIEQVEKECTPSVEVGQNSLIA
jgi:hypothetical protein